MVVQTDTTGDSTVWGALDNVFRYNLQQIQGGANILSTFFVEAQLAVAILMSFLSIILMYYPALFHGNYIWAWYILFLPVAVSFIITMILTVKGVSSS